CLVTGGALTFEPDLAGRSSSCESYPDTCPGRRSAGPAGGTSQLLERSVHPSDHQRRLGVFSAWRLPSHSRNGLGRKKEPVSFEHGSTFRPLEVVKEGASGL